MSGDNWQHRSDTMRCRTCMWWVAKKPDLNPTVEHDRPQLVRELGRCRRHAPSMAGWPANFSDDWCGDHKLDADKI